MKIQPSPPSFSPNGINSRLWVSVCIALGILSAGSPTEAVTFTFQSGDFFAFDTGTVSNSSSGSHLGDLRQPVGESVLKKKIDRVFGRRSVFVVSGHCWCCVWI